MVYYKLIQDLKIIAVGTSRNLRKHQKKHNVLIECGENEAQYIEVNNKVYWDVWMKLPVDANLVPFEKAEVVGITEDEYSELLDAIEKDEEVSAELFEYQVQVPQAVEEESYDVENYTLDYIREVKIKELQLACTKAITEGFGVELSDRKSHHFSLSIQDQTNLNSLQMQILSGADELPYHADGEEEMLYSVDDMTIIINAANAHKVYHLAYFNSLKKWVNALRKNTTVSAVKYGDEIPKKYQSAYFSKLTG